MSRIKLKYNESEIQNNLYTFGAEWQTADKQEYKGLYHRYTVTQETYTGATWNESTSQPLYVLVQEPESVATYNDIRKQSKPNYNSIRSTQPIITAQDIANKFITRYFLKKVNEPAYFEISQKQYVNYNNELDTNLYAAASCKWYIAGETETVYQPIYKPGVVELNTNAITQLQTTLPGISQILTNPLQYYTDTDFVVPRDINLG